jgi:para-nitrobenzyl esterase
MVWIHGGAYSGGTGNTPIYWGDRLAEQGEVVVVTFNYRLGAFGFLAHPALKAEDPSGSTGNYGTLDQIAALRWVKENIAGFGGDPTRVTIFGESAGGWSVCTLLATPLAKGLFQRAIMQSGGCDSSQPLEAGYTFTAEIAKKVGCPEDDLSCLRAVPTDKLLKYTGGLLHTLDYKNHHDGHVLSATPLDTIRTGSFNRVPMIAGHNRDEFTWTSSLIPANTATLPFIYELYIKQFIANPAGLDTEQQKQLLALYPPGAYKYKPIDAINAMITDIAISCPTYLGALASAEQGSKTWFYRFVYDEAKVKILLGIYLPMGASHGIEIAFVFNNMDRKPSSLALGQLDQAELAGISKTLMGYWTAFARGNDPGGVGLLSWSPFEADAPAAQVIDTSVESQGLATGATSFDARCRFWDQVTVPGSLFDKLGQQSKQ